MLVGDCRRYPIARLRQAIVLLCWSFSLHTRILCTVYHTPLGRGFPCSIARQPRGCECRTKRLRKALGDMFPTSTLLAPLALFQLWKYRPWKIHQEGCDVHCRTRYMYQVSLLAFGTREGKNVSKIKNYGYEQVSATRGRPGC